MITTVVLHNAYSLFTRIDGTALWYEFKSQYMCVQFLKLTQKLIQSTSNEFSSHFHINNTHYALLEWYLISVYIKILMIIRSLFVDIYIRKCYDSYLTM